VKASYLLVRRIGTLVEDKPILYSSSQV